ncbi:MAG TPA: hypothetical protein VNI54_13690 [Thermoanaerobaculia bacterium]|nr:hypothetical protein [Thermoanaerobaculia bacterium]
MKTFICVVALAAAATAFAHPGSGIAVHAGRVYFVDTGGGVFALEGTRVSRVPGPAFHWFAVDPRGQFRNVRIPGGDLAPAGPLLMSSDVPVVVGTDGAFYYAKGNQLVRVGADGRQSVRATLPRVEWANDLAAGPNGSIYYTEDAAVRKVDAAGRITTVAERVAVPNCVSIPGNTKPYLRGLAVAPDGSIYVAAAGCGALLKIDPRGRVAPLLRTASPWAATAVAVANGEVYVLEYSHTEGDDRSRWYPRVRKIARDGKVTNLGGSGRK